MTAKRLPVLFLSDVVLLPGMVVPIELDEAAQAAVDAAKDSGELLVAPRLEDRYASYGVVATVEKVGKFRGGAAAAVLRTGERARIGSGVTGPGAALWVEAEPVESTAGERPRQVELAAEYKKLVVAVLQKREAWQIIDSVNAIDDPATLADTAGWAPYLSNDRKRELLETPDVEARLTQLDRVDARVPRRSPRSTRRSPRTSASRSRRPSASSCCGSSSPRSARSSARGSRTAPTTTAHASRRPTCRTTSVRPRCARSTSSSGRATRTPRPAGSGPGSTPCSSCRGARRPRTRPTWPRRARCSTPTTTGWTR